MGDFDRAAEISMETWLAGSGRSLSAVSPAVLPRVRELSEHALRRAAGRNPPPEISPGAAGRLESVKAPTLLMVGEYELPNVRATVDFLGRGIAGAQRVEFAHAAH